MSKDRNFLTSLRVTHLDNMITWGTLYGIHGQDFSSNEAQKQGKQREFGNSDPRDTEHGHTLGKNNITYLTSFM